MKLSDMPVLIDIPFARDATGSYVRDIPDSTATAGAASYTLGFPPITAQPLESGGIPPDIKDFNGVLRALSRWVNWQGAGAPVVYDSVFVATVGGYPKGAQLASTVTTGLIWRSTVDDNTTDPDGGSATGWERLVGSANLVDGAVGTAALADQGVTNAKLANGGVNTVKGRLGTGNTTDVTMSQLISLLSAFGGDSGSGGTKGLVPAPPAGANAAGYLPLANGTWGKADLSLQNLTIHSGVNGYWFQLGPLIVNVGIASSIGPDSKTTKSYPSGPYPNALLWYNAGVRRTTFNSGTDAVAEVEGSTTNNAQITLVNNNINGNPVIDVTWIAIGF